MPEISNFYRLYFKYNNGKGKTLRINDANIALSDNVRMLMVSKIIASGIFNTSEKMINAFLKGEAVKEMCEQVI